MKEKWTEPKTTIEEFVPNEYIAACALTDKHEFILDPSLALATNTNILIDAGSDKLFVYGVDTEVKGTNQLNNATSVRFIGYGWDVGNGNPKLETITQKYLDENCAYYALVEQTTNSSPHGFSVAEQIWLEKNAS